MPLFEYTCNSCKNEFEELVSGEKADNPACPECASDNTERKMSVFGGLSGKSMGSSSCGSSRFT
jgi:putative FmdB family regulatory protein